MNRTIYTLTYTILRQFGFAAMHGEYLFLVSRIGCGIAGFKASEMAPLFAKAIDLPNVVSPKDFAEAIVAAP